MKKRLEAIKARADAATPGPWEHCHEVTNLAYIAILGQSLDNQPHYVRSPGREIVSDGARHDAALIAHARSDIPWLLERAAELVKALETLVTPDNGYCNQCKGRWLYRLDGSYVYSDGQHNAWCIGRALLDVKVPNA